MKSMKEYMSLSRELRRKHLVLDSSCDNRGGESKHFKGLLAHFLDTSIPSGREAFLCHACNNGGCSNVAHLYWGTPKDNHLDQVEAGTYRSLYERTVEKHGTEYVKQLAKKLGQDRKGKSSHNKYSVEKFETYKNVIENADKTWGWIKRCSDELGISHTQVRRFINKYLDH